MNEEKINEILNDLKGAIKNCGNENAVLIASESMYQILKDNLKAEKHNFLEKCIPVEILKNYGIDIYYWALCEIKDEGVYIREVEE